MQAGIQIGKYSIGKKLGAGGMADVYLATDTAMGRDVALKVLPPEFARNAERVHRFQKEVQASAALSHPNIIPVYDFGETQVAGLTYHYYTMALFPGGDLKQRIERGLTPEQSLSIIKALAEALGYAHDKGLVHRDIKPENILFDESDRPILTDLGIAKAINSGTKMTGTGMSIGTPHYMSPEQAKGESGLDGRSDIYALGIMLFEMLTGQVPYQGDNTMAVGIMHIQNPLPELPQHLSQYQGLLDNCLAKDKANRYQHAQSLIQDIGKLLQGQAVKASQKTRVVQGVNHHSQVTSSQGFKWGVGGALIAALLVVGVYFYMQSSSSRINSQPLRPQASNAIQSDTQPNQPAVLSTSETNLKPELAAQLTINRKLDELSKAVEADIAALRLIKPAGNNALQKIDEMETLKPNNVRSAALTTQVLEKLRYLTLNALTEKQFYKAQNLIDTIDVIKPDYSQLHVLRADLAKQKKQHEEAQLRIAAAIKEAHTAIQNSQLKKAENAITTIKQIAPSHPELLDLEGAFQKAKRNYSNVSRYVGTLITIDSGSFNMGCSEKDNQCKDNENPRHLVIVPAFKIMEGELTRGMFGKFIESTNYVTDSEKLGGCYAFQNEWKKHENLTWKNTSGNEKDPVVCVSFNDVTEYIKWLNEITGKSFRLPTEEQWEYASRGGAKTKFFWGNIPSSNHANGSEEFGWPDDGNLNKVASSLDLYEKNSFGLINTIGNVAELTNSCWRIDYSTDEKNCFYRVVRGGDWKGLISSLRSSSRQKIRRNYRNAYTGFRLVLDN